MRSTKNSYSRTSVNTAKREGRSTQPRPRSGGTSIRSGATSPLAQASRLARLAVIRLQAIASAALVPEDVGLVSEDRVAGNSVVGWQRSFEAADYHHTARVEGGLGGSGWNVMDDLVPLDLHAPGPKQRNADSGDRWGFFRGWACARVVPYLVIHHVKHTRRPRCIGEEQYPVAVVVDLVSSDLAMEGIAHEDAEQIIVGFVGGYGRVCMRRVTHIDSSLTGAACKVGDDLRPARGEGGDPVFSIVEGTVLHEPGVLGAKGDDTEVLEVPGRKAGYGHILYVARNLASVEVHVAKHANARIALRFSRGGRLQHSIVSY